MLVTKFRANANARNALRRKGTSDQHNGKGIKLNKQVQGCGVTMCVGSQKGSKVEGPNREEKTLHRVGDEEGQYRGV
jgi:hypothetical protein